ncbi:MAG: DUF2127 domain-containing protein [Paracoccaceae bacterium]
MSSPTAARTDKRPPIERSWLARRLHWVFEASLVIKGLLASGEAVGGLGLLLTPNMAILHLVAWLTKHEIAQDPTDPMANWFRQAAEAFPIQTQHFYAFYLTGHGFLKLLMVFMLARRILWAYPIAMVVLAGFVAYQLHHWTTSPSPVLLLLSGLDSLMIVLVYREWREMKGAWAGLR